MGRSKVVDAAVDAGIPADTPGLEANAVNTLGTASVRNIDMATRLRDLRGARVSRRPPGTPCRR